MENSEALGATGNAGEQTLVLSGANETQTITNNQSTAFTLSFNGATTISLPASATALQVKTALAALPTVAGFTANITGASNTTPITINVGAPTDLVNGEKVTLAIVGGNTAADGTWTIANVGALGESFQLVGSVGNHAWTSGGTVTLAGVGGTVAVTGGPGSYSVTFGGTLAGQNLPLITSSSPR